MNPAIRAFYGALLGALAVLLIHPASRNYLTPGIWLAPRSEFLEETDALPDNLTELPTPDSLENVAFWLIVGCEREVLRQPLNHDQALLMVEFARAGAERDPDNAFWRQVEAVFQHKLGNEDAARQAWLVASFAGRWDDYQTGRLKHVLEGLKEESGRTLS